MVCLRAHDGYVMCIATRPDGKQVASGSGDMSIRLWDARTAQDRFEARVAWYRMLERETPRVDALLDAHSDPWDAYLALREDPGNEPETRRKALNLVLARLQARRDTAGDAHPPQPPGPGQEKIDPSTVLSRDKPGF